MRFHEFHEGQVIELGPLRVTEAEILAFARSFDPQWFHVDPRAAREGPFGGLIASGWHTCALAMRLVADGVLAGSESFASPGIRQIEWPNPLRPGDELRLRATVLEARRARRNERRGVLRWRWQMSRQDGLDVLRLEATSLFALQAAHD